MGSVKIITLLFIGFFFPATLLWAAEGVRSAEVIEVMESGSYTIMQVRQGDGDSWLAANRLEIVVGDKVEYMGGVPMTDFYVSGLDRTFPEILFLTNIRHKPSDAEKAESEAEAARQPAAAMPDDDYHKNVGAGPAVAAPLAGEVRKAEAELTIAEIYAQRENLGDKVISVRGKVLKVSKNILGRTWVTLSDGTGLAPDNVLRVTTVQEVELGETVSATGTVTTAIDLGAGYQYKVILEEAEFSR